MLALRVAVRHVAVREVERRAEGRPVVGAQRERRRDEAEEEPAGAAPRAHRRVRADREHREPDRVVEEDADAEREPGEGQPPRRALPPREQEARKRPERGRVLLEQRRCEGSGERRRPEDRRGRRARAGHEPLRGAAEQEDRAQEEQPARGEADPPEREVALALPAARRPGGADGTLHHVRRNRQEGHARRLVGVRAPPVDRAVEERRLDRQRMVQHEVARELVARAVLRVRDVHDRQGGQGDEREHDRLEPIARQLHRPNATPPPGPPGARNAPRQAVSCGR